MVNKKKTAGKGKKKTKAPVKKPALKKIARRKAVKKTAAKACSPARKSPFKSAQLSAIKKDLMKEREQLVDQISSIKGETLSKSQKDASGDLSGYTLHMADMATDLYNREFSLELAEGERERLYNLEEALKRIDEGSYGCCDLCGCAIPRQRLKALPQARYCIKCQEKEEKTTNE
ncbi:MAG: TraR/DksA family transcriptional regulator [Candidatus Omnitrophica bacterium]|jgi:RNA polymerase-binding protein DksA|nr:TraR/DksA family transcriptional regulator [Candidatus Omnitrophota bacterium]MDD4012747.1 TraR/DksA family transcriptional regulator [Candidatus Omnitrophota bacterium]